MGTIEKICNFVSKYMAVAIILTTATALVFPSAFVGITPHISFLLGIVMFGMGMTLKTKDFQGIWQHPKDVLAGVLAQFTIMPLVALLLTKIFSLPPDIAVGVILVGTCPGGTASNVMTYLAKGDVALSVSMTMTTTIISPIMTPLLTWCLADAWIEVSFTAMMLSIMKVVILPVVAGIVVNVLFNNFVRRILKILPLISIIAIILILAGVVGISADRIKETGLIIMAVVMLHNILGYALGYVVAKSMRMELAKSKAIAIEVGMQNSGLATSLAMLHFNAAAAIPGAIFSVWHNISGSLAANYLSKKR